MPITWNGTVIKGSPFLKFFNGEMFKPYSGMDNDL
jgi:hypothetical protein